MLCYRCGSYTPDDSRKCAVCGQPIATRRRTSRNLVGGTSGQLKAIPPLNPGEVIEGRYRIIEPVGTGTTGWLFRARDEEVDIDVAVKLIAANLLQTEDERSVFLKAVKSAKKVHHANVVRLFDSGRGERNLYYTMPFLEGLSLRRIIDLRFEKDQGFSFNETLPLIGQLSLAIDAMEKMGGHGALRPSNIMVLPDVLKVTALPHFRGLPRKPFIALQTRAGAAEYLAPEARREESAVDRRADIYSAAVIFGEMATGVVYGRNPVAWDRALARLPRSMGAALIRALSETAASRFDTASALFEALVEATAGIAQPPAEGLVPEESTLGSTPGATPMLAEFTDGQSATPAVPTRDLLIRAATPSLAPEAVALDPLQREMSVSDGPRPDRQPITLRPRERRGYRKQPPFLGWLAATVLLAGIAVSAAIYYRQRPTLPEFRPVPETPSTVPDKPARPSSTSRPKAQDDRAIRPLDKPMERVPVKPAAPERPDDRRPVQEKAKAVRPVEPTPLEAKLGHLKATLGSEEKPAEPVKPPEPPPPPPAPVAVTLAPPTAAAAGPQCPPGMVAIEGGSFEMGTRPSDPMRGFGELAAVRRDVDPFCIDVYEFPNQKGRVPLTNISWNNARKICQKAGRRLCSEAEWEKACKGPSVSVFPFGNKFDPAFCNIAENEGEDRRLVEAGVYGRCRSGYGVVDMTGNAAEWTSSQFAKDVPDRVIKGGASDQGSYMGRCAARGNEAANGHQAKLGFRCCADLK